MKTCPVGARFRADSHDEADRDFANAKFCKGVRSFDITISVDYSVCNKNRVTAQEFAVRSYFSFPTIHKMMLKTCLMQSSQVLRP